MSCTARCSVRTPDVNVHPPDGGPPPALESGPAMLAIAPARRARSTRMRRGTARSTRCSRRGATSSSSAATTTRASTISSPPPASRTAPSTGTSATRTSSRACSRARAVQAVGAAVIGDARHLRRSTAPTGTRGAAALAPPLPRRARQRGRDAARLGRRRAPGPGPARRVRAAARLGPPADVARTCAPRGFGDVDIDAVVMVALLGVFGARPRPAAEVDAAAHIIERGLLGR